MIYEKTAADFDFKIRIDTIAGDNADKTPMIEQVATITINVSSREFGINDGEDDVIHTLYYLSARQGGGENPTIADSVYLNYEGFRLDGEIFDSRLGTGVWFDLPGTGAPTNLGVINGFRNGLPQFRDGNQVADNPDGTFEILDSGIGIIFMPSGLAYFNGTQPGEAYAPIAFKINLLATNIADLAR